MNNHKSQYRLTREEELLSRDQEAALFYINKDYKKEEIVRLAQNLQQRIIEEQNENMFLRKQITAMSQQSPRKNPQESEICKQCDIAIKKYQNLIIEYQKLFKVNEKIQAQKEIVEGKYKDFINVLKQQNEETQKKFFKYQLEIVQTQEQQIIPFPKVTQYERQFNTFQENFQNVSGQCNNTIKNYQKLFEQKQKNNQNFGAVLIQINGVKQIIDELINQYEHFRKSKNITDVQINNALENHQSSLQLNKKIMNQMQDMLILMHKDIENQEKINYQLEQENNKLREQIKNITKTCQKEIDENMQILQSLMQRQNQKSNQTNTNQIIDNYNRFKDTLRLLNEEFYQILLQFSSQGLTISQLQLQLSNQQNLSNIIENQKQILQKSIPQNSQQLSVILNQFKNFFNSLKQYIDDRNKLIDVFQIQDNFFSSYEKVIKKLLETENLEQHL